MTAPTSQPSTLKYRSANVLLEGSLQPAEVTVADGLVTAITSGSALQTAFDTVPDSGMPEVHDLGEAIVCPAPLDIHFHGACGISVPPDGTIKALDSALDRYRRDASAVTMSVPYRYLATLPTPVDTREAQLSSRDVVKQLAIAATQVGASPGCVGLRVEGTFLNPQRAGVWPPETFASPDIGLFDEMFDAASGMLAIIDIAPELSGAIPLIEHAVSRGCVAALAHTEASYDEAIRAIDAGATVATHTFNAMRPLHHREPGVVGAVLTDDRVTCEVIADGAHLHPATLDLIRRATGGGLRIAFVSDASPFAGSGAGKYEWAGMQLVSDGQTIRDANGNLAGSVQLLDSVAHGFSALGARSLPKSAHSPSVNDVISLSISGHNVLTPNRPSGLQLGDGIWII